MTLQQQLLSFQLDLLEDASRKIDPEAQVEDLDASALQTASDLIETILLTAEPADYGTSLPKDFQTKLSEFQRMVSTLHGRASGLTSID